MELAVCADPPSDAALLKAAARLSVDLGLPFIKKPRKTGYDALVVVTAARLELRVLRGDAATRGGRPVCADLTRIDAASGPGRSLKQPIARAVGRKRMADPAPVVIDATGGFGEDAWLLASLGCQVLTVERSPIVAALLRDGLLRAGVDQPDVLARCHTVRADAKHLLRRIAHALDAATANRRTNRSLSLATLAKRAGDAAAAVGGGAADVPTQLERFYAPDVVYLDPMFPHGRKAAERKPMRVLRRLVGDDTDADELLHWALRVARRRVVVKRPSLADPLADVKPTTRHKGKAARYDVYVTAA